MEEAQPSLTAENTSEPKPGVKNSIETLKKKFLPGVKYSLLFSIAVSFSLLVVGAINVHKCPAKEEIPLFLVAIGGIGLMSALISYLRDRIIPHFKTKYLESSLYSASIIFLILGMYWTYSAFKPSWDSKDGNKYCDKTAYMFAFVYVTIIPALILALILGFCCFLLCACCLTVAAQDAAHPDIEAGGDVTPTTPANDIIQTREPTARNGQ